MESVITMLEQHTDLHYIWSPFLKWVINSVSHHIVILIFFCITSILLSSIGQHHALWTTAEQIWHSPCSPGHKEPRVGFCGLFSHSIWGKHSRLHLIIMQILRLKFPQKRKHAAYTPVLHSAQRVERRTGMWERWGGLGKRLVPFNAEKVSLFLAAKALNSD